MIRIRGQEIDVDVVEEISVIDWKKAKPKTDELVACSPFREERNPSFSINLETGLWKDFGSDSDQWKQGNLIQLLSWHYNVTYEEIEDYLLEKHNATITEVEGLELDINLKMGKEKPKTFTREELAPYLFRKKSYLLKRGVSEEIQKKFIVGYDKESDAVAFFWLDAFTGKVVNVKFRKTDSKQFYYIRGGQPVKNHIFGLYQAIKDGCKKVYIVESEIDALYLWTNGIPAIALGGSYLSPAQKRLLLLSGIDTFVIATDADDAGRRIANSLQKELAGYVELLTIKLPTYAKDINDVKKEDIKKVTDSEKPVTLTVSLHQD
jgi:DNA primase